jgi:hypothetical protein
LFGLNNIDGDKPNVIQTIRQTVSILLKRFFLQLVAHNLLCVLIKFVVFNPIAVEQAYTPPEHRAADANRRAFHCLPDTRIANAANVTATAERTFFQV